MKFEALSAILTFVNLYQLVEGKNSTDSVEKNATDSHRRIFFGERGVAHDFPYLVKLDLNPGNVAGAVIADYWIVTVAHILNDRSCSSIGLIPVISQSQESIRPVSCYQHPQYTKQLAYDIGMIKSSASLLSIDGVQAIPLPPPSTEFPPGSRALVAGWGFTEDNQLPDHFVKTELIVDTWDYCNDQWQTAFCHPRPRQDCQPHDMPNRVICTRGEGDMPPSTCFGDSGSPVVINGLLAGVVSFGSAKGTTCDVGQASMHISIVDYLPWIYSHTDPGKYTGEMKVRPENGI